MGSISKVKEGHEYRMNWGGAFAYPDLDPDVYNRYSPYRQMELKKVRDLILENSNASLFTLFNPKTRSPYKNQILLKDIIDNKKINFSLVPEIPFWFKYSVPQGLSSRFLELPYEGVTLSEEELNDLIKSLELKLSNHNIIESCTKEKMLVREKPVNGVFSFIWRVTRYIIGYDTCIPISSFIDLMDGISYLCNVKINPTQSKILNFIDLKTNILVEYLNENPYSSLSRWAKVNGLVK